MFLFINDQANMTCTPCEHTIMSLLPNASISPVTHKRGCSDISMAFMTLL